MIKKLLSHIISEYVMLVLRVYLGVGWFTSGLGKVMGGGFDASGFLQNAVQNPVLGPDGNPVYPWYTFLIENVFLSMTPVINVMIPWAELLVGLGLIIGGFTAYAAFFGLLMNFSFLFAGTVSVNPLYILLGVIIIAAGYKAGSLGVDRFIKPALEKGTFRIFSHRRPERKTA
ncbi:DoxX family protein [Salinicoccus halodurans]|uniref:DoxX family protein n=1 Tax=Salinicoccus halodurans TaxID=407035 RepID=A0A0F7D4Z0_9STAP|nr:DoxX family protein [Salinicoccus halodurans]AKG75070.1 DoxX family protein [Salinicoccus halodurans]SFK65362.1 thiosulfate dehydrogenase [quinone] large subunit [Salinicoccus halodurans]